MLQSLKIQNDWTNKDLKQHMRARGICLRNGKEYGQRLPQILRDYPAMTVNLKKVKGYDLAKKCLVDTD
jgi:hypothetical protein